MKNNIVENLIKVNILIAIEKALGNEFSGEVPISESLFEDFDFQSPLFFKIRDSKVVNSIINILRENPLFDEVSQTGKGFLSLKINTEQYLKNFIESINQLDIEYSQKKVLVDYCGVNVAKQMHIGHIRSMFIGDYIVRTHLAAQDQVIIQNHIGDWGSQFGFLLGYVLKNNIKVESNKQLTDIYKKATELYAQDEQFKEYAHSITEKLNNKDDEVLSLWSKAVDLSMKSAQDFFEKFNLNIDLSHTCGESFYADKVQSVVDDLVANSVATVTEDGSVVVFFEGNKFSPLVLKKSSGAYLYAAYDLAAIQYRIKHFEPEKIVYVVDKRQDLHFKQIFHIANQMGWSKNTELSHVGFGAILGQDKKPIKTRSGQSLYLDDLIQTGFETYAADQKEKFNNIDIPEEISHKTVIGALKYYDLHMGYKEDYVFDWKDVLNTQGNSAPYLQNAFVRIDSILMKLNDEDFQSLDIFEKSGKKYFSMNDMVIHLNSTDIASINFSLLNASSKALIFNTIAVVDELHSQSHTYASNKLSQKLLKCAKSFHAFYENNKVLGSDCEKDLIKLIKFCGYALYYGMNNLGIDAYPCNDRISQNKINKKKPTSVKC